MIQDLVRESTKVDILFDDKVINEGCITQFDEKLNLLRVEFGDTPTIMFIPYHAITSISISSVKQKDSSIGFFI